MNEGLIAEIKAELKIELREENHLDEDLLTVKIRGAYRDVQSALRFEPTKSEAAIEKEMANYFSQIKAIALYDYNKIGAEGQKNYSADGENISYEDRNKLFYGILPKARC